MAKIAPELYVKEEEKGGIKQIVDKKVVTDTKRRSVLDRTVGWRKATEAERDLNDQGLLLPEPEPRKPGARPRRFQG